MKYEYYSLKGRDIDIDKLNLLGEQGRELVTIRPRPDKRVELIFKRELNELIIDDLALENKLLKERIRSLETLLKQNKDE